MGDPNQGLAATILASVATGGGGYWFLKVFFAYLKGYKDRLESISEAQEEFEKKVDVKFARIETSLEFLKDNKEKLNKREDDFENGVVKILRSYKQKGRFE